MVDLEVFSDRVSQQTILIMQAAEEQARLRQHNCVLPEHILLAIARHDRQTFNDELTKLHRDPLLFLQELEAKLLKSNYSGQDAEMMLRDMLAKALKQAHTQGRRKIEPRDLLRAEYKEDENEAKEGILKRIFKRIVAKGSSRGGENRWRMQG